MQKAAYYDVPPAYVVAHVSSVAANKARKEAQLAMLSIGLTRAQVALAFQRNLRRVRRSVIGEPPAPHVESSSVEEPAPASATL